MEGQVMFLITGIIQFPLETMNSTLSLQGSPHHHQKKKSSSKFCFSSYNYVLADSPPPSWLPASMLTAPEWSFLSRVLSSKESTLPKEKSSLCPQLL